MTIQEKAKIRELKENLQNTDFKVLKCYEASMLDEPLPYDLPELVAERRAWRAELNELESIRATEINPI